MNIEVRIEELMLHGFAPGDRRGIGAAVEQELTRLLAERGISPELAKTNTVENLDGGSFKLAAGSKAEAIGVQVAQAVHGGLTR
ncbi:MAG TPA: hypothetical protein VL486_03570 [Verrucomicrobiae bacterium]|nr:hypothetical protein [Verrucomicrobiae bacterium]